MRKKRGMDLGTLVLDNVIFLVGQYVVFTFLSPICKKPSKNAIYIFVSRKLWDREIEMASKIQNL
jgi:hypothetical protein